MIYGDLQNAIESLNTGSTPDNVAFLTKLICGKIAKKRLPDRQKLATIATNGSTIINLRTSLPDFLDFKLDVNRENRIIYSLDTNNNPTFYQLISPGEFAENTLGGYAKKEGRIITIKVNEGETVPATIYFPYYSFYAWTDTITGLEKETPDNNDDECLLPSVFDDVIVDGILLYISRREKESKEFEKNLISWNKSVDEIIFYS